MKDSIQCAHLKIIQLYAALTASLTGSASHKLIGKEGFLMKEIGIRGTSDDFTFNLKSETEGHELFNEEVWADAIATMGAPKELKTWHYFSPGDRITCAMTEKSTSDNVVAVVLVGERVMAGSARDSELQAEYNRGK